MKLAALLAQLAPVLEGRAPADPPRLAIYARFCKAHRYDSLAFVFAETASRLGDAFAAEVEAYYHAHPMHSVELNTNGEGFPAFLAARHSPWIAQGADFEWWEWTTRNVFSEVNRDGNALRIGSTVEIRPYAYDFTLAEAPKRDVLIVFWRDPDDALRRERLSPDELAVLRAVYQGQAVPAHLAETKEDLLKAGILT